MVKNTGGNRAKKFASKRTNKGGTGGQKRGTRLSQDQNEIYAAVDKIVGGGACKVISYDGTAMHCIIRKKFRGRSKRDNIIARGTWVLVGAYDWNSGTTNKEPKCDLLEVYSSIDKEFIKQNVKLNFSILQSVGILNSEEEKFDDSIQFVDDDMAFEDLTAIENEEKITLGGDTTEINIDDL